MEFMFGLAVGVGLGWIVFKRPEWAENIVERARDALNRG